MAYSPVLGHDVETNLELGESPGSWRVSRPAGEGGLGRGWGLATMAVQVGSGHPGGPQDLTGGDPACKDQAVGSYQG